LLTKLSQKISLTINVLKIMLKCSNLSAGYKNVIIKNVSLHVKSGEITAILGPNGSGKTTLLKTIATIIKPIDGIVYIDGKDVTKLSQKELAKKLSITTTEKIDAGFMTGFEVVALGRYPYTDVMGKLNEKDKKIVEDCLNLVNASYLANKTFSEMSDGEKQKIMIARALAQEPKLLLLDEPTSYLDVKHRVEIMLLLRKIAKKGVAIFFTTHDVELALRICDKVILILNGRILNYGIPEEVLNDTTVKKVYNIKNSKFDCRTGTFEFTSCKNNETKLNVHVVCGGGSGAKVMRFLVKKEIPFTAGVLHSGDIDCCIAETSAEICIKERAFEEINDKNLQKTVELAKDVVIDTGFPIGTINKKNTILFDISRYLITFREKEEFKKISDRRENVFFVKNIKELNYVLQSLL